MFNEKKAETLALKSETRKGCLLSPLLLNIIFAGTRQDK